MDDDLHFLDQNNSLNLSSDSRAVRFFDRRELVDAFTSTLLGHACKDYFTAHGENAAFVAKTYYHTTTALRQLGNGSDSLSSVTVSKSMFETIARDLLLERTDRTIELYEGSGSNCRLVKSGSPGNLGSFEDILFANNEMQDSPATVALLPNFRENGCTIGLGYIDLTKRVVGLAEFLDDSQFTNVESALVGLGCRECLLPVDVAKSTEGRGLLDALSRCGSIEPVRDLVSGLEIAPAALEALLSYAEMLSDETNYGNFTIKPYNLDSCMRLDSAAMRALNVMESKNDANKNFSLFGLMNRTCTAGMGKRLLHMWLKQPLLDVNEINDRLNLVQAFVEDIELCQELRQHLKRISDIDRLTRNLQKKKAGLHHVVKLYQSSIRLPYIKSALEKYEGQFSPLIKERFFEPLGICSDDDHLNKFVALVETSVDLDQLENGEYMISSGYDSRLLELKEEQESLESNIDSLHKKAADDLDLTDKVLKLEKGTQFGHVFRITKKEEPKIRKKLTTQFIVLETRKDGVKFTNSKLKKLGDQYQRILEEYKNCQKELVQRVVQTAATFSEVFESLAALLAELDVLLGFADLATSCPTPYTRPDITPSDVGDIILEGSRHPCVEAQDWVNFIPNDCKLVRGQSWFQIITGPNMGGKSTFIRQLIGDIMSLSSEPPFLFVIAYLLVLVLAIVNCEECPLFMQEMLETASILKGATDKSLIIIDELGRGTSTYDGFALAHDNREGEPSNKKIIGVANYHVSAHIDSSSRKLTMLYKVEPGACDQSFGIHVAEFANFPESVVSLAREKAAELEDFSPATINAVDLSKQSYDLCTTCLEVYSDIPDSGHFKRDKNGKGNLIPMLSLRVQQGLTSFLKEFAELPLEQMDMKQALDHVNKMKSDLEKDSENCHWLKQFL
uniref:DNA mismatch repair proteins mutS family domain-containing protein n=1 Tax=Chenopodium quinoa TaxID=63459 RepID=A0A803NC62_CHEQI